MGMGRLYDFIKRYISRDPANFLLLFANFVLLTFLLWNTADLIYRIKLEGDVIEKYDYYVSVTLDTFEAGEAVEITEEMVSGLIRVLRSHQAIHPKIMVYIDVDGNNYVEEISVILSDTEKLACLAGGLSRNQDGGVFVGENFASETGEVTIFRDTYPLGGVYENDVSGGYDDRISVFYHTLTEKSVGMLIQYLQQSDTVSLEFEADEAMDGELDDCCEEICDLGFGTVTGSAKEDVNYFSGVYKSFHKAGMAAVSIFAVANCYIVVCIWMERRRKEFAIKKAFGYGWRDFFTEIVRDIAVCMVLAFPSSLVIQLIYATATGENLLTGRLIVVKYVVVALGLIAVALFAVWIPLYRIWKMEPVEGIEKR